jgi:nitroimidazol reductase NimA-like FMN-containing flavoprotein (pyridoxamine 5'-phosphate oxidase superfamily)
MKGDLNSNQINNLLSSQAIGRLACCDGKYPYIIPMTYTYDGNYIYGQTNEGKKLDIMRTNPNIAFQVDSYLDIYNWQSVIVYGQFEEIKDNKDNYARELLLKKVMPLLTPSNSKENNHSNIGVVELSENTIPETILFRISINEKTGKFDRQ